MQIANLCPKCGSEDTSGILLPGWCQNCQEQTRLGNVRTISSAENSATSATPNLGCLLFNEWEGEYKPLLGKSSRWDGFCYIMRDQLAREQPVIVETGTLRESGNWKGDGQSTRLWQWIMEHKRGVALSVDRNEKACEQAARECDKVRVVCSDSVAFLRGFLPFGFTLLYLDSMQWGLDFPSCVDCWMNQVAELAAVWGNLPSGCLIASDDSQAKDVGKPVLTRRLFEALGIEPEYDGYIVCWRKP